VRKGDVLRVSEPSPQGISGTPEIPEGVERKHWPVVSPGEDLRLVSVPSDGPGKGLLHTDNQGKQLRGDLPEELPFSLNRGQGMDQRPILVFVGEDLKPFG